MGNDTFTINRVGTAGHAIRDPDGNVVAWPADANWAQLIVALLNRAESERLGRLDGPGCEVRPTGT
jgi:hypothetical protein